MLNKSRTFPFWLFTISAIFILIISQLIQDGMFMDGMVYVSVSKNLAKGLGTFWDPYFSSSCMSSYHEQPPLYFGLLALFFKLFGTSLYIERLFCFVCYSITAFYIYKIWSKIYAAKTIIKNNSWLPILFWTIIPVCFWAYTNNVEETVMTVFITASIYYIYCAIFLNETPFFNLFISAILIFLSSLTKGVQGMFPLISVCLYMVVFGNISFKKMFTYSLILVLVPLLLYGFLLIINPNVYLSFIKYFNARYVPTFSNAMNTTSNRLGIIKVLFFELLPIIILSGLIMIFTKKHKNTDLTSKLENKTIFWFFLIGLSGSLPLLITLEQRRFYLVTVLPFFAIAFAMWVAPSVSTLISRINPSAKSFKIIKIVMVVFLITSIVYSITKIGDSKRDKDLLSDIYKVGKIIPNGDVVAIPPEMYNDYNLRAYFMRYFNISITCNNRCQYFIKRKDLPQKLVPENYKNYEAGTTDIDLYILTEQLK